MRKPTNSIRVTPLAIMSLLLMTTLAAPGSSLVADTRPAPDMCDDTQLVGKDDKWTLVDQAEPTSRGTVTIIPTLIAEEAGGPEDDPEHVFPYLLMGTLRYQYEIYECKDYTDVNSAGFFVYKYGSSFSEDQGIWSMGENDPVVANAAKRFMYACDQANCDQGAEPLTRSEVLTLAQIYATRWPNYSSALYGYGSLQVLGETIDFQGEYDVSSDTGNVFPTQTLRGCSVEAVVCVTASAQRSLL